MIKADLVAIGERIRLQRVTLGYTQQYVYDKIDISQNHYSRIENGHTGMSFDILLQLSELLGLSTDYILTGKLSSNDNYEIIKIYNSLSCNQKQYFSEQIKLLSKYKFWVPIY